MIDDYIVYKPLSIKINYVDLFSISKLHLIILKIQDDAHTVDDG